MAGHLERVAIVGAGGRVGGAFAKELLKTGRHTITALARKGSKNPVPSGCKTIEVDYDDADSLVAALQNIQFLIITLAVSAAPGTHGRICRAAGKAGVPYIMPNLYGQDFQNSKLREGSVIGGAYAQCIKDVEATGAHWIALVCGFWYEWSLALPSRGWFGFDIKDRRVVMYDDGNTKIDVSTWDQCGRAIASLLSLPVSGTKPCVEDWKNKLLYMHSFRVSQRDMLDSLHRVLGTSDADWQITYETTEQREKEGMAELQKGNMMAYAKVLYAQVMMPGRGGDFGSVRGLSNEVLGLPKEELDDATRDTVEMVESGWNPFVSHPRA